MICERCYRSDEEGAHGIGACPMQPRRFHAVVQDSIPGGFTVENAWREPRTFYSQSEYRAALDADGLMLNPHYVPGGKLANWAACMDPQTLENGRILAERQARTKASDTISVPLETLKWNTRVLEGTFTVKAEA